MGYLKTEYKQSGSSCISFSWNKPHHNLKLSQVGFITSALILAGILPTNSYLELWEEGLKNEKSKWNLHVWQLKPWWQSGHVQVCKWQLPVCVLHSPPLRQGLDKHGSITVSKEERQKTVKLWTHVEVRQILGNEKMTRVGLEPMTSGFTCRCSTSRANEPYVGGLPICLHLRYYSMHLFIR